MNAFTVQRDVVLLSAIIVIKININSITKIGRIAIINSNRRVDCDFGYTLPRSMKYQRVLFLQRIVQQPCSYSVALIITKATIRIDYCLFRQRLILCQDLEGFLQQTLIVICAWLIISTSKYFDSSSIPPVLSLMSNNSILFSLIKSYTCCTYVETGK